MTNQLIESSIKRLRSQKRPRPEELESFLVGFHDFKPGITENTFGACRTRDGLSSYQVLVDLAGNLEGATVVDLACGNGALSHLLAEKVGMAGKVIGIDMSKAELSLARERLIGRANVEFIDASAADLPLPSQSAQAVLCHLAFMLFNPVGPVVEEISRVLEPNGVFAAIVTEFSTSTFGELRSLLLDSLKIDGWEPQFLALGEPQAKDPAGLRSLFSPPHFDNFESKTFEIVLKGSPAELSDSLMEFFYHAVLLTDPTREKLRRKCESILGIETTVNLPITLRTVFARRCEK